MSESVRGKFCLLTLLGKNGVVSSVYVFHSKELYSIVQFIFYTKQINLLLSFPIGKALLAKELHHILYFVSFLLIKNVAFLEHLHLQTPEEVLPSLGQGI